MIPQVDVLIENFKPGTMEKWGLGPGEQVNLHEVYLSVTKSSTKTPRATPFPFPPPPLFSAVDDLFPLNPQLIYNRISGYGQTGPNSSYLQGFPGQPSVRANISLGDTMAGFQSVIGILLALMARNQRRVENSGRTGQVVDVALYESVFSLLEAVVPEYDRTGLIREPSGNTVTGIVPTSAFDCADGKAIIIGANGDSLFQRLCKAMGREDMVSLSPSFTPTHPLIEMQQAINPDYKTNIDRVKHQDYIYKVIGDWCLTLPAIEVQNILRKAEVPVGLIYNAKDIVEDEHFRAREMIETVDVRGKPLKIPAYTPKLQDTPGETLWAGPELGEHTASVLISLLGMSDDDVDVLEKADIIELYKDGYAT
ncbi:hypothetical protein HDU93_002492 [Gonapodya sp. JEL0774]|nr:hypothetical protein HDU93_002492 [Gonapodya sp. JEL0774]